MSYEVKVTRNFQITIPASIRDKLGIRVGDRLMVRLEGERIIVEKLKGDLTKVKIRLGKRVDWRYVEEVVREAAEEAVEKLEAK